MIVKHRGNNVYDVFFGDKGWNEWACFQRDRGQLTLINGSRVPSRVYRDLFKSILGR